MYSTESQESWIMVMIHAHYSRGLTLWQTLAFRFRSGPSFVWKVFTVKTLQNELFFNLSYQRTAESVRQRVSRAHPE